MKEYDNFFKSYDQFLLNILNPIGESMRITIEIIKEKCKNSVKIVRKANLKKKNNEIDYLLVNNNLKGLEAIYYYMKERGELSEISGIKKLKMYDIPKNFRMLLEKSNLGPIQKELKNL